MRVAKLDLDDCPAGFISRLVSGSQRSCVVKEDGPGCTPVLFSSFDIKYSRVCGKIRGYRVGSLDGFHAYDENARVERSYRIPPQLI